MSVSYRTLHNDPSKRVIRALVGGLTLMELLTALAIIIIVAAIAYPLASLARERASQSRCANNLRQLHLATSLYRIDNNGEGKLGSAFEMGLPPVRGPEGQYVSEWLVPALNPCWAAPKPWVGAGRLGYFYRPTPGTGGAISDVWRHFAMQYGEETMLWTDLNHNPAEHPYMNFRVPIYGLGVRLSGTLVRKSATGNPDAETWWQGKP